MTPDEIQGLLQLPVIGILIYLLVREGNKSDKLLGEMLLMSRQHAKDLVEMACHGFKLKEPQE